MQLLRTTLATMVALTFATAGPAFAKKAPEPGESLSLVRGVEAVDIGTEKAEGRFHADGSAISLFGSSFRAARSTPEAMAREYLAAEHAKFGLTAADVGKFSLSHLRAGDDFSVVRFKQFVEGLPVYRSDIAISVTPEGKIIFVANAATRGLGDVDKSKANRTQAQALSVAHNYLGVDVQDEVTEQMVYRTPAGETRIVWRVNATPVEKLGNWDLLIDAETGEVLRAEDIAAYADGTTTVFNADPLSSARQVYNNATGWGDNNNADSPQLTSQLFTLPLRDITLSAGSYSLAGPNAACQEHSAPADGACPTQASPDFPFTRSHLFFDALNVYYHIDTYMRYVNTTLGITIRPSAYTTGVRYDPHGLNGADNASYSSGTQRLQFGTGGVDDAQDADVVVHELGHGLHDWVTGNNLSQVQGLSEGFGDYVASAYSRDIPNQWLPADTAYNWMFNWDGHNEYWAGRINNYQLSIVYASLSGAIHTMGQYWASCNLVARGRMNTTQAMDIAYFRGMSMTTNNTNQRDAAQAIVNAAQTLGYTPDQMQALAYAYNAGNTGGNTGCTYNVTMPALPDLIYRHGFDSTP